MDIEATPTNKEKPPVKKDMDEGDEVIYGEEKIILFEVKGAGDCAKLRFVLLFSDI